MLCPSMPELILEPSISLPSLTMQRPWVVEKMAQHGKKYRKALILNYTMYLKKPTSIYSYIQKQRSASFLHGKLM